MNNCELMSGDFFADESGVGTIELVLILVVLITLVAAFKSGATELLDSIIKKINKGAKGITG